MNERLVSMIKPRTRVLAVLALCIGLMPAAARAQFAHVASAGPAPLYPYELQPGQSYAVQVAPGAYVIHRAAPSRDYPYVSCVTGCERARRPAHVTHRRFDRTPRRNDPALIEELRTRSAKKGNKKGKTRKAPKIETEVIHTTRVVRDPPVVIEHRRVVEDPPRVIERRHYVEDAPPAEPEKRVSRADGKRVIHAEAEVTILGPDRMSIRLFRKGDAPPAGKR
jgi:hypothetical protein